MKKIIIIATAVLLVLLTLLAVFCRGELLALPAKQHIPNFNETYEARYFAPAPNHAVRFNGEWYDSREVLFELDENTVVGVEIGVEIWSRERWEEEQKRISEHMQEKDRREMDADLNEMS